MASLNYDYVIVGVGSAGYVLAAGLSEDPVGRVALAGGSRSSRLAPASSAFLLDLPASMQT